MNISQQHYSSWIHKSSKTWVLSDEYNNFWSEQISKHLEIKRNDKIIDLGSGNGKISSIICSHMKINNKILCIDSSKECFKHIDTNHCEAIHSTIEDFILNNNGLSYDKVIIKQAFHHIQEEIRQEIIKKVYFGLNNNGKMMVLTMPETIEYPMFDAAINIFEKDQLAHDELYRTLLNSGFRVTKIPIDYPVIVFKNNFYNSIRARFISTLSHFSNEEIEEGILEIDQKYSSPDIYRFFDRLWAFIGRK